MKKLIYFLSLVTLLVACTEKPGYQISGTTSNAELDGKNVYIYGYGKDAAVIDSALIQNGKFKFKGVRMDSTLCVLRLGDDVIEALPEEQKESFQTAFILGNGKMQATLGEISTVSGTPENDAWTALQTEINTIQADRKAVVKSFESKDSAVLAKAEKQYDEMMAKTADAAETYIRAHANWQTSAKLLNDNKYSFSESEQRELIGLSGDNFKSVYGINRIIDHLAVLEKVAIGKKFTDFEMADPKGKTRKLSDYAGKGKIVLVDFWASWCGPCRKDMPHMVDVYKKYKNKKFEIVGVSLDRTAEDWTKGIDELKMKWPQLSDLKFWQSKGAALYGVNSIPHTVLIDKDGVIIAKNLRGEALDAKMAELFK